MVSAHDTYLGLPDPRKNLQVQMFTFPLDSSKKVVEVHYWQHDESSEHFDVEHDDVVVSTKGADKVLS